MRLGYWFGGWDWNDSFGLGCCYVMDCVGLKCMLVLGGWYWVVKVGWKKVGEVVFDWYMF